MKLKINLYISFFILYFSSIAACDSIINEKLNNKHFLIGFATLCIGGLFLYFYNPLKTNIEVQKPVESQTFLDTNTRGTSVNEDQLEKVKILEDTSPNIDITRKMTFKEYNTCMDPEIATQSNETQLKNCLGDQLTPPPPPKNPSYELIYKDREFDDKNLIVNGMNKVFYNQDLSFSDLEKLNEIKARIGDDAFMELSAHNDPDLVSSWLAMFF